jgi:hypothetical protein
MGFGGAGESAAVRGHREDQFPMVPGLVRTTTLTAFKAYSKADLEQGWDIGSS